MLTQDQTDTLWNDTLAAQVRSLYFADLGSRYTRQKQIITGIAFFFSSGAAATVVAHAPAWIPVVMSVSTAVLTAYAIAVGLDKKASTMAKLHYAWSEIENDRRLLWNHWYEEDAEARLGEINGRDLEASQTAITDAPYDKGLIHKWQIFVYKQNTSVPA
jgi:hypothetical protein